MEKGNVTSITIVAIFLGIILIVVFVYLVYYYGKGSRLDCGLCRAKFTNWCSACSTTTPTAWDSVEMDDYLKKCANEMWDCLRVDETTNCGSLKDECKSYIPVLE